MGIGLTSLRRYIAEGKVPAPVSTVIGDSELRAWTKEDIERLRALLLQTAERPGIRSNGGNKNKRRESANVNKRATPGGLTPNAP